MFARPYSSVGSRLTIKPAIEIEQGRNERGQKIPASQVVEDTIRNVIPIGVQGLLKGNVPGGATNLDQLVKASGATVYKYRTEAEKLAQEKSSDHTPTGPVEPAALEKHQKKLVLEDGLRNGEISRGDVFRSLPQREANEVVEHSRMTPLQARFNRLPLNDAVDVWALATPTERDELHKLLWDKRRSYIQNHTPAQRNEDPVWLKLQSVYGDLHGR